MADIAEGEVLEARHVRSIRPGYGLPPAEIVAILGRPAARNLQRGEALSWDMIA